MHLLELQSQTNLLTHILYLFLVDFGHSETLLLLFVEDVMQYGEGVVLVALNDGKTLGLL